MTDGAEALAGTLRRAIGRRPFTASVGTARIAAGGQLAVVSGITVEPIRVDRANWSSTFIASVAAGRADGRRVKVSFCDGQPVIDFVIGD